MNDWTPDQSEVMCRQRKWQVAVGGCDDGDSGGGGGQADSVEQMDEVSLKLPTDRRGPQQPGRYAAEVVWRQGAGTTCLRTQETTNRSTHTVYLPTFHFCICRSILANSIMGSSTDRRAVLGIDAPDLPQQEAASHGACRDIKTSLLSG